MSEVRRYQSLRRPLLATLFAVSIGLLAILTNIFATPDILNLDAWLGISGIAVGILGLVFSAYTLRRSDERYGTDSELTKDTLHRIRAAISARLETSRAMPRISTTVRHQAQRQNADPDGSVEPFFVDETVLADLLLKDRRLLLTGPAGSGKTTGLLLIARELLDKDSENKSPAIPVVVSLSPWRPESDHLTDWLTRTVSDQFAVPIHVIEDWLSTGRLIPLLDGLDEVPQPLDAAQKILDWVSGATIPIIAVSTRPGDASEALRPLFAEVAIEPLPATEVLRYLSEALPEGVDPQELVALINQDPALQQVSRSPWFLVKLASYIAAGLPISAISINRVAIVDAIRPPGLDTYLEGLKPAEQRILEVMRQGVSYDMSQIGSSARLTPSVTRKALTELVTSGVIRELLGPSDGRRYRLIVPFSTGYGEP